MRNSFTSITIILFSIFGLQHISAQTTAMDFQRMDCNGNMQHLFADLDAGNAVILEFFMQNCTPCINAGNKLEIMKTALLSEFPGRVKGYAIGFTDAYTCQSNAAWVSNNGFTSIPMDSGATQVGYYGGFGMPSIVILGGGVAHSILGSPYIGFSTSDTTTMASDIRDFLAIPTSVREIQMETNAVSLFPNPTADRIDLKMNVAETGNLSIQVLDLAGKQVVVWMNENTSTGTFSRSFNTAFLPNGSYMVRVNANEKVSNYKINVLH